MTKLKKRYSFWKVFWVVLGLNLLFTVLGFIALSVSPIYSKQFNWNNLFTWHYLLSQCISIAFSSAFYFFAVNGYYNLFYERRPASDYIKPTVLAIVVLLIVTCLTVVFITDYYSTYGGLFSNAIYETTGRLPLSGTKALDAESVQFGIERAKALAEFTVTSAEDINYGLSKYSLPDAISPDNTSSDDSRVDSGVPVPGERETEIIYVVYSESLTKSGGL
jgi:hypothetical protein